MIYMYEESTDSVTLYDKKRMSNVFSSETEDYYVRLYSREKTQDQYWKGVCEEWIQSLPLKRM